LLYQILRGLIGLCFALISAASASAQQPTPPDVALWRVEANGDAIQTDLGFVLPARWRGFERKGFTSTRPDGGSVMTYYERADGPIRLRILIQLRADVRGVPMPGANGVERNWPLIQSAADIEYFQKSQGEPQDLIDGPLIWGSARAPNARIRLRRYRLAEGAEIQGVWYRNIGLWAVAAIVSAPDSRESDVEETGAAIMTQMPWPAAPLTAELQALAPQFPDELPACGDIDRAGDGQTVDPGPAISAMIATALSANFLDSARTVPHPVLDPRPYCRIEKFSVGRYEVVALGWRGDHQAYPSARYAFMLPDSGIFLQFESLFNLDGMAEADRRGIRRPVWLTFSGTRKVELLAVLTDWPSYERAKEMIVAIGNRARTPIVEITHPSGQIYARVNYTAESVQPPPAPPR
jgi:hypothetical protein